MENNIMSLEKNPRKILGRKGEKYNVLGEKSKQNIET
jgi:hypothetical protein